MDYLVQIIISALACFGFALSVFGALRLFAQSRAGVRRMNDDRLVRDRLIRESSVSRQLINVLPEGEQEAAKETARLRWVEGHASAGLEPYIWTSVSHGREFLAERIIKELGESTRKDVSLVLAGLTLGLVSALLDTWLN